MRVRIRPALGLLALVATAGHAAAQGVNLTDPVKPGDCFKYEISLAVEGKLKVDRDGKPDAIPLAARAAHTFVERVEAVEARGGVGKALRHYATAGSESAVGAERGKRDLGADRKLIVAQRTADGSLHFSPDGPLGRDELELVAEHFDTLVLPALLPGKEVKPGDAWPVGPEATQHACHFEGLIKGDLAGKLTEVKDGAAAFTITGIAEGVETGAVVKVSVTAAGKFDVASGRITELKWEQTDDRGQGPASPASEVKAVISLKRTPLAEEPKELGPDARAKLPADGKPTDVLTQLRYADPAGRYQFVYARDWHVVGRTGDHLVLRLLDKGEFTAQATVTVWKKAAAGQHATPAEFQEAVAKLPGWQAEEVLADGPVSTDPGRWLYRLTARGRQDGLPVVQTFFLLAGSSGDQLAVTILARAEKAAQVGTRDLALTNAIEFRK
ncbi:MAG: hypothetical protein U0871_00860 [Gemmataceae bacterium]